MKKFLSLLLVAVMLLGTVTVLSSCSSVSEKSFEKDAYGTVTTSVKKAYGGFFGDDSGAYRVFERAMEGGMIGVALESETLLGEIDRVEETLYFDKEDDRVVSDTAITYQGEQLALRADLSEKAMIFSGESIFGSDEAYMIDLLTLEADLENSTLLEMLGVSAEDIAELKEILFAEESERELFEDPEQFAEFCNELLAVCRPVTGSEKVDGTACATVTYTVDNDTLDALVRLGLERTVEDAMDREEAYVAFDEATDFESLTLSVTLKLYVAKQSGSLVKAELKGSTAGLDTEKYERDTVEAVLLIGKNEISFEMSESASAWYQVADKHETSRILLTKNEKKDATEYALSVRVSHDGEDSAPLLMTHRYEKESGDFELSISLEAEGATDRVRFTVEGDVHATKKEATVAIRSISYRDVTLSLGLVFTAKRDVEIPAPREDAKNLLTLTEEEVNALVEEFQSSKLFELIG